MTYSSEVLADSPVGYWHLDETSGTSAADSSGNSRTGTYVGSPTLAATSLLTFGGGTAVSLLGSSSQRCTVAHNSAFNIASSSAGFTFECWVKLTNPSSSALQIIADKTNLSTSNGQWVIYWDNRNIGAGTVNNLRFRYTGGSTVPLDWSGSTPAAALAAGGHLVCVAESGAVRIYWNGTQVASGTRDATGPTGSTQTLSFGATSAGANYLTGTLDEIAVYNSALSSTRVGVHYAAGAGIVLAGQVDAVSGTEGAVTATLALAGQVDATSDAEGTLATSTTDYALSGQVDAVSGTQGTLIGTVATETVDMGLTFGMDVSDQPIAFGVETVGLGLSLGLAAGDVKIHGVETVEMGLSVGLRAFTPRSWGEGVRTGRPEPRLDVVDRAGTMVTTLSQATLKPLTCGVNVMDRWGFSVVRADDRSRKIQPVAHEARLYRGDVLMASGPIGPGLHDDASSTYECADPRWHLSDGRRRIGRIPKRQLLRNPGFTEGGNGLAFWQGAWDEGSALTAAPEASVVPEPYARSGKALQLGGVDKVTTTKAVVETAAVFYGNRPYAWEPLMNGFQPGGAAAITAVANTMTGPSPTVHITGHTADADSGDGYALSLRRAQAARLVVLARWPSATVTVEGKGETEPIAKGHTEAAYRKNRRVELEFGTTQTAVGHRQFYRQTGTITQPTDAKVPLPLTFAADMRIITWLGAPKDGWAILIRLTRGSTVIDEANATMDEFTPRVRWAHYEGTVEVPADGVATKWEVRLYPPAGASRWANVGLWPQEQLGFFDVDQALIVKGIVEHVQDETLGHGDLGIGTRTPTTGIPRTREYPYHERMPADTALEWFTSIDRGLDIDYDRDRNEIVTHCPRQGTSTDVVLIHSRKGNVVAYRPLSSSAQVIASNVIIQADGSGASRPEGYARDSNALGGTLVETVISAEEDTPLSELDEGAASALAASLRARPGWEVVIDPDFTTEFLDRTEKGDTLRLVLPDEDVDGAHRLAMFEWNPATDTITATLVEEV